MWGTLWLLVACSHREMSISLSTCLLEPLPPPTLYSSLRTSAFPGFSFPQGCHTCSSGATDLAAPARPKGNSCSSLEDSLFLPLLLPGQFIPAAPLSISSCRHSCQVLSRAQGICHMSNFSILTRQLPP